MLQSKIDDYGKTSSLLNFHENSLTICVDIQVCELLFLFQIKSRQIEKKKTFFFWGLIRSNTQRNDIFVSFIIEEQTFSAGFKYTLVKTINRYYLTQSRKTGPSRNNTDQISNDVSDSTTEIIFNSFPTALSESWWNMLFRVGR